MKIAPADTAPPRGLANAIQRVQANIDRRGARAGLESREPSTTEAGGAAHVPGANALAQLQANLARKTGAIDEVELTPVEPAPPADEIQPASAPVPAPAPAPCAGGLIDILA